MKPCGSNLQPSTSNAQLVNARRRIPLLLVVLALAVAALVLASRTKLLPSPRAALEGGGELALAVLDVGQGDAIVVRAPSGRTMLVDAGNSSRDAREVILPYLERQGIERLDVVVLTHPDQDHLGGLPDVLQRVPVGRFLDSGQASTNRAYQRTLEVALEKHIPSERARFPRTTVDLSPEVAVQVLGPQEPLLSQGDSAENNNSIVLRVRYGDTAALLTGDLEREGEARLLATGQELRSQVLKVGHHGSSTSSSPAFLDAVRPEVALISAGAGNRYGHPHKETLASLERRRIAIYRTDQQSTLTVHMRTNGYRVETAR
ncbi:MAG: MBL fold metallo-hydrolase [Chloroflexi bacterium]|nr:MBL fold metallo-hydrolase [Chloroflexota bacterium]